MECLVIFKVIFFFLKQKIEWDCFNSLDSAWTPKRKKSLPPSSTSAIYYQHNLYHITSKMSSTQTIASNVNLRHFESLIYSGVNGNGCWVWVTKLLLRWNASPCTARPTQHNATYHDRPLNQLWQGFVESRAGHLTRFHVRRTGPPCIGAYRPANERLKQAYWWPVMGN